MYNLRLHEVIKFLSYTVVYNEYRRSETVGGIFVARIYLG